MFRLSSSCYNRRRRNLHGQAEDAARRVFDFFERNRLTALADKEAADKEAADKEAAAAVNKDTVDAVDASTAVNAPAAANAVDAVGAPAVKEDIVQSPPVASADSAQEASTTSTDATTTTTVTVTAPEVPKDAVKDDKAPVENAFPSPPWKELLWYVDYESERAADRAAKIARAAERATASSSSSSASSSSPSNSREKRPRAPPSSGPSSNDGAVAEPPSQKRATDNGV